MSRAYDFTVVAVITIISIIVHRMALELFAPDQPLYSVATDGTGVVNGTQHANLWFQIIGIWAPLGAAGGIICWAIVREYRRSVQTATKQAPR